MSYPQHSVTVILPLDVPPPEVRRHPKVVFLGSKAFLIAAIFACFVVTVAGAEPGRKTLRDTLPPALARLTPVSQVPVTTNLVLALGLPLRNESELNELLGQLYDPQSTNYHRFLTPEQFTARFGPTEADYAVVKNFALTNGFTITGTNRTRLLLDVRAPVADVDRAFHVTLRNYRHPHEARNFFGPDVGPTVGATIPIQQISGLDNYSLRRPMSVIRPLTKTVAAVPHAGSGPGGNYLGNDFRAAYVPGTTLTGSGQNVALVQFDAYYASDIAAYISLAGLTNYPVNLTNVAVNGGVTAPGGGNVEVCLDIEMVISMAPGVSKIFVYEAPNPTSWSTMLGRIASDNFAKQISCSWGNSSPGGKDFISEFFFKQMAAQGQSFFNATGDSGALVNGVPFPSESTNITQVGGTMLSTTGAGGAWSSESAWNHGDGTGTSGGVSANYEIPGWQKGVDMTGNHGSLTYRNVPDVAFTGDNVYVTYDNGSAAAARGTSCAAPLWAAFMALVNEQAATQGKGPVGFINPAVYAIGKSSIYDSCFNDIATGNNFNSSSPTNFPAVPGYDLCTGWGTPKGANLINALITPPPLILTQPASRNVTNGMNVALLATASGAPPLGYQWLLNGTNLADGGNISGTAGTQLSLLSVTSENAGNYQLVVTNLTGSTTSSVAILNVGFAPTVSVQPASQTNLAGSNTAWVGLVNGSAPQAFRWRRNGASLVDGAVYSGVTTTNLLLTALTTSQAGSYTLVATNLFGAATSSVVSLTVVSPARITGGITNRTIECGSNVTFTVAASGTAPLNYQWSLDGLPMPGATNASRSFTNVHLPNHIITVVVTNLYDSATSNALLSVQDTKVPVILLSGANPLLVELGGTFNDPGASATDVCAGSLPVVFGGNVNPNMPGTNLLSYTAADGNGNSNLATRTVIVRDTMPPTISWSFTNLVLTTDASCSVVMPDVTGTNFIIAADLSGPVAISQFPTNTAVLPLGTNVLLLTVVDASGNAAYSTNVLVVLDGSPPVIILQPQSQTNFVGAGAIFTVGATACMPVAFQWFFQDAILAGATNSTLALTNLQSIDDGFYFALAASDGGFATSAVVSLAVLLTNHVVVTTGGVTLTLVGTPGQTYILETATNLAPAGWLPVATNALGASGLWQFNDPAASSFPQRFYRLREGQ